MTRNKHYHDSQYVEYEDVKGIRWCLYIKEKIKSLIHKLQQHHNNDTLFTKLCKDVFECQSIRMNHKCTIVLDEEPSGVIYYKGGLYDAIDLAVLTKSLLLIKERKYTLSTTDELEHYYKCNIEWVELPV